MCPACESKRVHGPIDWAQHPYAGHGYASGQGWTHPDLAPPCPYGITIGFAEAACELKSGHAGPHSIKHNGVRREVPDAGSRDLAPVKEKENDAR